jgi:hypothetical protein
MDTLAGLEACRDHRTGQTLFATLRRRILAGIAAAFLPVAVPFCLKDLSGNLFHLRNDLMQIIMHIKIPDHRFKHHPPA